MHVLRSPQKACIWNIFHPRPYTTKNGSIHPNKFLGSIAIGRKKEPKLAWKSMELRHQMSPITHGLIQVHNLLSEIPKTEKLRKPNIFSMDVVCTPKLAFGAKLEPKPPTANPCHAVVPQCSYQSDARRLCCSRIFCLFFADFVYFEDCENVKKSCRFPYG